MLDSIIELAKDSSDAQRHELVEHVTERFVARAGSTRSEEIAAYNGILEGVYDKLPNEDRQKISDRLADVDTTSSALAGKVARDDLPIARRMLKDSKSLKEADLLEVASTQSQEHLLAMSKRNHLSSRLTKKLLEHGKKEVKQSVALNLGAEITKEEFEDIVKELPKKMGDKVRHLRKSTEELIQDLLKDSSEVMNGAPLEKKESRIPVKQWMLGIRAGHVTLAKAISQLAMEKNLFDITVLLGVVAGLEQKHVESLMIRFDATGISTLCRAVGIDDTTYSGICTGRCNHLKFPSSTGNKWLTNYHVLDPEDAKRIFELVKFKLQNDTAEAA